MLPRRLCAKRFRLEPVPGAWRRAASTIHGGEPQLHLLRLQLREAELRHKLLRGKLLEECSIHRVLRELVTDVAQALRREPPGHTEPLEPVASTAEPLLGHRRPLANQVTPPGVAAWPRQPRLAGRGSRSRGATAAPPALPCPRSGTRSRKLVATSRKLVANLIANLVANPDRLAKTSPACASPLKKRCLHHEPFSFCKRKARGARFRKAIWVCD